MKHLQKISVGTVSNPLGCKIQRKLPVFQSVEIIYPHRLNAMALDPQKINPAKNRVYSAGEIVFTAGIYTKISVSATSDNCLEISEMSERKPLIRHAAIIMKKALGIKHGLRIDVENQNEIKHAGLGSSSALIAGVAASINELFGNPIRKDKLVQYVAQNHGEEIEGNEEFLAPVQCLGGSAAAGIIGGGIIVLAGQSRIIKTMKLDKDYKIIIGIPADFEPPDAFDSLKKEIKNIGGFVECGKKYGPIIAYRILHECLPAMDESDFGPIGRLVYDYRFSMGSIRNCSFTYPKINGIMRNLAFLKNRNIADVLSISSVGPGVFAISRNASACVRAMQNEGLRTVVTEPENNGYKVVKKQNFGDSFWNVRKHIQLFGKRPVNPIFEKVLSSVRGKPGKKALDIGCGAGRHSELLASLKFNTFAVDTSPMMITETSARLAKFYGKNEASNRVKQCAMDSLCFPDNTFDVVVSTGVFHQARSQKEYKKSIQEASRVLKKGGLLVADVFIEQAKDQYCNLGRGVVLTKEGLLMTLLSEKMFFRIAEHAGLKLIRKPIIETKNIETGTRRILRAVMRKS
jgi:ubiquinone/menaquinone biosynthesis C-methylase UbiE/homoserine kinase